MMSRKTKKWNLSHFPVELVQVARENDLLYDLFGIANLDDHNLALSIRENGIQEPLAISNDHVLLSGHRRLAAAKCLGLKAVPVRLVEIVFDDLSVEERLETLRSHNLQREKLRDAITSVIDVAEFNAQIELEKADAAKVEAHRRVVFNAIKGVT